MKDDTLFGVIAVQEGFLTQAQLDEARLDQDGRSIGEVLLERGILTEPQIQTILDIQKVHIAEAAAPAETGGILRQDRLMLPCSGCDTYYLVQGYAEGTKFVCRKCLRILTVTRNPAPPARDTGRFGARRTIGAYEIGGELARGSMSVVFKAVHTPTGKPVALKVLKESDNPSPNPLKRFQQEARAASRLSHPNIVRVREAGEVDGTFFIAMDLVEGVTLDRALAGGKLRLREFVAVLEKVALALHHAHQYAVIHRDLKPANIILDASGEPHLTDFGLAKMDHIDKGATHTGAALGTPFYMSPEQVEGDIAGTDARSDIYSMGVMLYEALTGRVPFPGHSVMEVYRGILSGSVVPPSQVNPKAPPDLEAVCLKALKRDKRDRYVSAREFADDLRRHLDGHPVLAALPGRKG